MNGKTSGLFRAIVHFIDSQGSPLGGEGWTARVRDRDCLLDDLLGEERVAADGSAKFLISVADIKSLDSPDERNPDLYFTLYRKGREVFRSEVLEDVDFEALDAVSGEPRQITQEFGPFCVEAA